MISKILTHRAFIAFTIFYIAFAFITYKDWGPTGDEKAAYDGGQSLSDYYSKPTTIDTLYYYATNTNIELRSNPLQYTHYRFIDMLYYKLNPNEYYEWYHLFDLLFSYLIFLGIYLFALKVFSKPNYAVLAPIGLFTIPGFLGHIPANPKDIPFAIFYFLSLTSIIYTKKSSGYTQVFLLGILIGFAQSIRLIGLSLYLLFVFYHLAIMWREKSFNKNNLLKLILNTLLIFILANFIMTITWPFIGMNYFNNIVYYFRNSADFQQWNNTIFYLGQYLTKMQRPWHYLFVWLLITTPVSILIFFFASLFKIKKYYKYDSFLLLLSALFINILAYIIAKPVIYNGYRHFLFLIPVILMIAFYSFVEFLTKWKSYKYGKIEILLVLLYFTLTIFRMAILHPYEYIYFNELIGGLKGVENQFEKDYWGATYKEASTWLADYIKNKNIKHAKVYACNDVFSVNYYSQAKFAIAGHAADADFIICDYDNDKLEKYNLPIIHTIGREGVVLNYIRSVNPNL